ncbi:hypothetical protein GS682_31755 [Nostoc sp. B(2019)]|nr:hypothetical protein [Nostoc sp. B(2019)]
MTRYKEGDRVQTPVGDGSVISTERDWDRECIWVEVRLDAPVTQSGCHGNTVTQSVGEFKESGIQKINETHD